MFLFAKIQQAVGFAHVGIGLFLGIAQNDLWQELYLTITGLVFFGVGRLIEPRT